MVNSEIIHKHLTKIGLTSEELDILGVKGQVQYLKFYHHKRWGESSILFIGFNDDNTIALTHIAEKCNLTVKNRLSDDLDFICISENSDTKRIKQAEKYNAIILSEENFNLIFNNSVYDLFNFNLIHDSNVSKEFRIAKPLNNFNNNLEVESFSFDSEEKYFVNLYHMTCTCYDFKKKHRNQYLIGDIRRLCKHLISIYNNNFGVYGSSDLNKFIIESGYPVNRYFKYFNIQNIPLPVVVNYEESNGWWNIFMTNEKGIYFRYGFSPLENRFSNNEKPIGFVPILREKLKELNDQLNGKPEIKPPRSKHPNPSISNTNSAQKLIKTNWSEINYRTVILLIIKLLALGYVLYLIF